MQVELADVFDGEEEQLLRGRVRVRRERRRQRPPSSLLQLRTLSPLRVHPWLKRRLSSRQLAALSAFWLGISALWLPLMTMLLPKQVAMLAPERKGEALGDTLLLGALSSIVMAPLFGAMSDMSRNANGRRRPFMVLGVGLVTLGLLVMSVTPPLWVLALSFLVVSAGNNVLMAPYSALVPDVTPAAQRGTAAGWLGAFTMLGYMFAGVIGYQVNTLGVAWAYLLLALLHAATCFVTVLCVPEVPLPPHKDYVRPPHESAEDEGLDDELDFEQEQPEQEANEEELERHEDFTIWHCLRFFWRAFGDSDFVWLFVSRFLFQMGMLTLQEFLSFYLSDVIKEFRLPLFGTVAEHAEQALSLLIAPLLVGAFVSSAYAGIISDRLGRRKVIVYASGATIALAALLFAVNTNFALCFFISLLFGIGYGAFSAIDWALATDVMPCPKYFGQDMGIWSLSVVLPQVLVAPFSGGILDSYRRHDSLRSGYVVVFLVSALEILLGALAVKMIRKVN
ncbi:MAG: hypothetical protein MHM6MM_000889 [Cercozoa sp. M6MM]